MEWCGRYPSRERLKCHSNGLLRPAQATLPVPLLQISGRYYIMHNISFGSIVSPLLVYFSSFYVDLLTVEAFWEASCKCWSVPICSSEYVVLLIRSTYAVYSRLTCSQLFWNQVMQWLLLMMMMMMTTMTNDDDSVIHWRNISRWQTCKHRCQWRHSISLTVSSVADKCGRNKH